MTAISPQLTPELYFKINQQVKRVFPVYNDAVPAIERAINAEQATSVNLMKSSKLLHDIFAPVLYRDCIPADFIAFASGLSADAINKNIDLTTRLHLHHKRHWIEGTYLEILTGGWDAFNRQCQTDIHTAPKTLDAQSVLDECHALVSEGIRLRQFITEGRPILPNLRTVSMGGIGEACFKGQYAGYFEGIYGEVHHCSFEQSGHVLAHALIDLPSVQHYCQALAYAPLVLPYKTLQVKSPLQTFTHHHRFTPMFRPGGSNIDMRSPTIILGALDRYYCNATSIVPMPWKRNDVETEAIAAALVLPIAAMFTRSDIFEADPITGTPIVVDSPRDLIDDTTVEIYGHIQTIDASNLNAGWASCFDSSGRMIDMPPASLSWFQTILDQARPAHEVVLKDRSEASPSFA